MDDRCILCNRVIPEGRQVCWLCERRHSTPSDCIYFNEGNYICEYTGKDCAGYQCAYYDTINKEDDCMERIKFCLNDKIHITYPPEEVVCDLCGKVVKFKDMTEHRRYCPPADWRIPMEGDIHEEK